MAIPWLDDEMNYTTNPRRDCNGGPGIAAAIKSLP